MTIPATMLTFPSPVVGTPDTELRNIVRGNDNVLRGRVNDLITHAATVVVGPATATDNAVALFDGTTGKLIKNSPVLVVGGAVSGITSLTTTGNATLGDATSDVHTVTGVPTFNIGSGLFRIANGATVEFELNGATGQVGIGAAAQTDVGVLLDTVARPITANTEYDRFYVKATGALTVINATVSSIITTARFDEPKIVLAGTGAVTTAATVYVADAPTEATNNYALLVASGATGLQALTATTAAFTSASATTFTGALVGNASSATILATARTIWGQSFNGSADVSGALSGATTGAFSSNLTVGGTLGVTGATTLSSTLAMGGAITWGGDTNLYRLSANVLATDDAFQIRGYFQSDNGVGRIAVEHGASSNDFYSATTGFAAWRKLRFGAASYGFDFAGTERVTFDASGNVGIGTTAPTNYAGYTTLELSNTTGAVIRLVNTGIAAQFEMTATAAETIIKNVNNLPLLFGTNNTERMRIDASGNVGIGVTPSASKLDVNGEIRGRGNVLAYTHYALQRASGALELAVLKYWNGTGSPLSAGNQGDMVVIGNAGGDGLLFVNANAEKARISTGGYFKASNDGTYANATGNYHELRSAVNANPLAVFGHTGTNPYGFDISFPSAAPNNLVNYFAYYADSVTLRAALYSNGDWQTARGIYGRLDDTNSYFQLNGSDIATVVTGGAERMRIDASGNVGIGVTPATKLHVYEAGAVELRVEGVTGVKPVVGVRIKSDTTSDFTLRTLGTNEVQLYDNANARIQFAVKHTVAAGETSLFLYDVDNATLERVTVGAADSGGAGFKVLRIPN